MAIIGSGYDLSVGGAQGTGFQGLAYDVKYGVPLATWMAWGPITQQAWLEEYNRTPEQQNYSTEEKPWYFEEAQAFSDYRDGDRNIMEEIGQPILQTTSDIALGVGLLGLALLFRR